MYDAFMSLGHPPVGQAQRTAWQLVADRTFGTIFWGKFISVFAVWAFTIAAAIVTYEVTGSALLVGVVGAAQYLPQLVLGPWSGKQSDKHGAVPQILGGRVLCALAAITLGCVLLKFDDDAHGAVFLFVAAFATGIGFAIGSPAMQAIVPQLVTREELPTAASLNTVPMIVARAVGPAAGGFLLVHIGSGWTFIVVGVCHAIFACALLTVTRPAHAAHERDTSVRGALRFVWSDRTSFVLLLGVAAVALGAEPSTSLAPVIARELGGSASVAGVIASTFGLGGVSGFLLQVSVVSRMSSARQASVGLFAMAAGLVVASAGYVRPALFAGMVITGMGMSWALSGLTALLQSRTPDALMGRVMALWLAAFGGSRPVASFASGGLADLFSARVSLSVTALAMVVVAILATPLRLDGQTPSLRGADQ